MFTLNVHLFDKLESVRDLGTCIHGIFMNLNGLPFVIIADTLYNLCFILLF